MFGKEILDLFGVSAVMLAILLAFWKGDEAISDEMREDISLRLMLAKPLTKKRFDSRAYVVGWMNYVFGDRHFSVKCLVRSSLVSIFLLLAFTYAIELFLDGYSGVDPQRHVVTRVFYPSDFLVIVFFVNFFADYLSIYKSRLILAKFENYFFGLIADLIITFFVFSAVVTLAMVTHSALWAGSNSNLWQIVLETWNLYFVGPVDPGNVTITYRIDGAEIIKEGELFFDGRTAILPALLTTFSTTAWSLLFFVGSTLIPVTQFTIPKFQYALPIDVKPIRSIGIFVTLLIFWVLAIWHTVDLIS